MQKYALPTLPMETNPSTFPIKNVKLKQTITPGCLYVSDQKFLEQIQCLKNL